MPHPAPLSRPLHGNPGVPRPLRDGDRDFTHRKQPVNRTSITLRPRSSAVVVRSHRAHTLRRRETPQRVRAGCGSALGAGHSSANASRRAASCSSERLVWMSSACAPWNASLTLSITASELSRNRAEVPGVTDCLTRSMNLSSIPTSVSEPASPPAAAPMASPSSGTKNSRPNSRPQKAPPSAPAAPRLRSCRVLGFFLPFLPGHHGGVLDLDQLLGLQLAERLHGPLRSVGVVELPHGERGHESSSRSVPPPRRRCHCRTAPAQRHHPCGVNAAVPSAHTLTPTG